MPWTNQVRTSTLVKPPTSGPITGGGPTVTIPNLSGFNSLIFVTTVANTDVSDPVFSALDIADMTVKSYRDIGGVLAPLDAYTYYMQANSGTVPYTGGCVMRTIYPLNGADTVTVTDGFQGNTTGPMSTVVYATDVQLEPTHNVFNTAQPDTTLLALDVYTVPTAGAVIPIPVTSDPIRIYAWCDGSSGHSSVQMSINDTNNESMILAQWTVPRSAAAGYPQGGQLGQGFYYNGLTPGAGPPAAAVTAQVNIAEPFTHLPHAMSPLTLNFPTITGTNIMNVFIQRAAATP